MFDLSAFRLQDMALCSTTIRRLGEGAASIEETAGRITRFLYTNLTTGPDEDPACVLVRAFKTHPYSRLTPELQALVDAKLGGPPASPDMKCLTLLGSTGAVPGWNNPALSSRFRVIPLAGPDALKRLPMFAQLFTQFHIDLPHLQETPTSLLLNKHSTAFNTFHVPQAINSPYVPGQQDFVVPFGVQSVFGCGGLLSTGDMFALILFSKIAVSKEIADLFQPIALSAKLTLSLFDHPQLTLPTAAATSDSSNTRTPMTLATLQDRVATLEALLAVKDHTIESQSRHLENNLAEAVTQGRILQKHSMRFEALSNTSPIGIFETDADGACLYTNAAWQAIADVTLADTLGDGWCRTILEEDRSRAVAAWSHTAKAGKDFSLEFRMQRSDGTIRWVHARSCPLKNEAGQVVGHVGITEDITERKQRDAELHEQRQRLQAIVEGTSDAVFIKDLQGKYLLFNAAAGRFVGKQPSEVIGRDDAVLFPSDEARAVMERDRQVMAGGTLRTYEDQVTTADGVRRTFSSTKGPLFDQQGAVSGIFGISRDITGQKHVEELIRQSEARFRQLANTVPVLIWVADTTKACTWFNDAWLAFTGRTVAQEYGNGWTEGVHPDDVQRCRETYGTAFDRRESFEIEYRRRRHDGIYHWLLDRGTPQYDVAGVFTGYIGGCVDIQGQRDTEERLRQTEERWAYAFEGSGDGVWDWNAVTNKVFFSNRWKDMLGYAPEEIGDSLEEWSSRVHPDDLPHVLDDIQRHFRGETTSYVNEHRMRGKDGSYKWILDRGKVISRLPDGSPLRVVGTHSDITTQNAFKEALEEGYCLRESILSNAVHAIIATDPSGIITSFNPAAEHMLGYRANETIGILTPTVFHDPDEVEARAEQFGSELGITLAPGFDVFIAKSRRGLPNQHEWAYVRKDGARIPVLLGISELRNSSNALLGYLLIATNLSERQKSTARLKEQTQRLHAIVDHAVDGIITINHRGVIKSFNPAAERMFGYAAVEVLGRNVKLLMPEPYHSEHDGYLTHYRRTGQAKIIGIGREVVGRRKDGSVFPLELGVSEIKTRSQQLFTGIVRDMTERKKAEAALAASEERLRLILDVATDGFWDWDLSTLQAFYSPRWIALLGLENHETPLNTVDDWKLRIHPDDRPQVEQTLTAHLAGQSASFNIEHRVRHHSGNWTWFAIQGQVTHWDHQGRPRRMMGVLNDITKRKQIEMVRFRLQQAVDHAQDGMALLDESGEFTYMNTAHAMIYGYAVDELLGKSWTRLYPEEWLAMIEQMYLPTLRSEGRWQGEVVGKKRSGEAFHVDLSLSLLEEPGTGRQTILCTCRDISHRKQMELDLITAKDAAEAGIRAKSEFLATMSHEIRTPMNGVLGMTDLLVDTALTPEQRGYVQTLTRSGESLMRIINDILDFSKIEAGKLTIETLPFDLRLTVEDTLDLLAPTAQAKNIELVGMIDAQIPNTVLGDPGRIRQILTNLVSNAIKFTERGEVLVQLFKAEETATAVLLRFGIVDTGIGMTEEITEKLFQSFTQADNSTTRKYGGTGLGLAICKRLTELMDGQIGIQSFPGVGTCIWFTIRLLTQTETASLASPALIDNLGGLRICLVDDNATNRSLLQYHACDWQMHYESAEDGPSALAMIRRAAAEGKPFDLAILDMHMPGMDGLALGRAIRDDANLDHTRLVLLTSLGRRGDAKEAHASGFSAYLTKPVRKKNLYDCLRLVMGQAPSAHTDSPAAPPAPPLITRHQVAEMHANLRLLVVDDNPVNQKVAVKMLEKLGYRVDVAGNGNEALAALTRHRYNLVFMDCQMPELDGFETTRMIRSHEQPGTRLPIIAMTANAMQGDREHCLSSGMDDFVSKPVKSQDLSKVLTQWLDQSDHRAAA